MNLKIIYLLLNQIHFSAMAKFVGYAMTLSTAQDLKGTSFPEVNTIIFDEFIIEEGQKKYYLQNEVVIFLNLLETIRENA